MSNINITDVNSFKTWLGTVPEADRLKAAQFVCGVWVAVTLPSIMHAFGEQLDQNDQIVKKGLAANPYCRMLRHVNLHGHDPAKSYCIQK